MEILIGIGIGIVISVVCRVILFNANAAGTLVIEDFDPSEPPYLCLELSEGVSYIYSKKYVTFKVKLKRPHQ